MEITGSMGGGRNLVKIIIYRQLINFSLNTFARILFSVGFFFFKVSVKDNQFGNHLLRDSFLKTCLDRSFDIHVCVFILYLKHVVL